MAKIKYSELRDNNTFAIHIIDINRPLFGEDIRCQVRYVRVDPFIQVDEIDCLLQSVIRSQYKDSRVQSFIEKKTKEETFRDSLHYDNNVMKVSVSICVKISSLDAEEYKHIKLMVDCYCEHAEHLDFFKDPIFEERSLTKEQWDKLEEVTNNQYMGYSSFIEQ